MKSSFNNFIVVTAIVLVAATAVIPSFANREKQAIKPIQSDKTTSLSYEDSVRYNTMFLDAILAEAAGKNDSAYSLLQKCIKLNPDAAEAYYYLASFESEKKNDSLALSHLIKAHALSPDNEDYQEQLAENYINAQQYAKAIDVYEALVKRHGDRSDVLQVLLQLYNQQKDYDNMLRTIERLEQNEGNSEGITLSKVRVYELKGDKKQAYKALQNLCETYPNDPNFRVMTGNWLMQNDRKKEAFSLYQGVLKEEPNNAMALAAMYDYYVSVNDSLQAKTIMNRILLSDKSDSKTKQSMIRQFIQSNEQTGGDSLKVLKMFDEVLKVSPKDAAIAELKAAYMSLKKMPTAQVDSALVELLSIDPDNKGARIQLLQDVWSSKDYTRVIQLSNMGLAYDPNEMSYYYFMSLAYIQLENTKQVVATIRKGMRHVTDQSNRNMVAELYAIMGDYLQKENKFKEAYAAYDSCLVYKSDNIYCMNNYAYYLSINGDDLQKAEQMSYKTVQAEPKNATYLDTYAWILFLQKRYTEAQIYIDLAIKNDTDSIQNSVIWEHAGDVYAKLGDIKTALDYWHKALKIGSGNTAILEKKIRLKKYIK